LGAGWFATCFLALSLLIFNSTGALVWAVAFVPLVLFASVHTQLRVALGLSALVFLFPALRASDMFPTEAVVEIATKYTNETRASSLEDRFECEDVLLEKAIQRPLWGWGAYSRNRVFTSDGHDISTTDGEWIIIFGQYGIAGFFAYFGLYLLPVVAAYRNRRRIAPRDMLFVTVLAVIAAVFAADNLPNSAGSIPQFFLSGALLGAVQGLVRETAQRKRRAREVANTVMADTALPAG
jgi:O-antigen ligase